MAQKLVVLMDLSLYHGGEGISVSDALAEVLVDRGVAKYAGTAPAGSGRRSATMDLRTEAAYASSEIDADRAGQTNHHLESRRI